MKTLILLPFIIFGLAANATNYYVSANGNDANNGTSTATPWKTLSKVNSFFSSLKPGDNIFLNRGDVFYGSITVNKSGAAGSPITIGAYGSGVKPVITGFNSITSWTNLGGNIWESNGGVSTLPYTNMVVINGVNTPMGRWPNSPNDALFQTHTGDNIITSDTLPSVGINWTGAEVVISTTTYTTTRGEIKAQSGNQVTYSKYSSGATMWQGSGKADRTAYYVNRYIIQNDPRTLDAQNEWYYNPSTKKLRIYSTSQPVNVRIATIDVLLTMNSGCNYITIDNISFEGSNKSSVVFGTQNYVTIQNCDFDYCGVNTIYGAQQGGDNNIGSRIINCTINHSNNMGITLGPGHKGLQINNNIVKNTGLDYGMAAGGNSSVAITAIGENNNFGYNVIDSTGYIGIDFRGNYSVVHNNLVKNSCIKESVKDGGAIYTWNQGGTPNMGRQVLNNIVINTGPESNGIYLDGGSAGVNIVGNTVYNCKFGLTLNSWNVTVRNNTFYHNSEASVLFRLTGSTPDFHDVILTDNIFFAKESREFGAWFIGDAINARRNMLSDSNYYAKPIGNTGRLILSHIAPTNTYGYYTLPSWQSSGYGHDLHSHFSPKTISRTGDLRFEYNATTSSKTISLDAKYVDAKGNIYNGSITLAPYTSAVLIKDGPISTNLLPVAAAGKDQSITLPLNSIQLLGNGSDADGTVVSYSWTKISGPSSASIGTASSSATTVSGLVTGIYQFELKVIDNQGAVGKDTVSVTVNAVVNIPPKAIAGSDLSVSMPTNTITLSGTGTDTDGTIKSYQWTKISGPSNYNIVNQNLAVTDVSGLMQGTYQFELKVNDNSGGTGRDTVQVNVNAAGNVTPTANAGSNKTITLPANTTTLTGSGSDADGNIKSYQWTKTSGPSSNNIVNPLSPVTEVSALVQGVYQFQLSVTDNQGAIGNSSVQIVVNAAINIPPTSNAGLTQSIELPINTVLLSGVGNDTDGKIVSYQWTKITGPAAYNIANPLSLVTQISGLIQGIYQFELAVTDNNGGVGKDTVQISVGKGAITGFVSPNMAPTAHAGNDTTIIAPVTSINLTGSGTDPDGTISGYSWSQIAGPTATAISPNGAALTTISNLEEGTYIFELTVTDNEGAKASDTVKVTVALGRLARESNDIMIYPNPVSDIANLEINTGKLNTSLVIVITDMSGKAVYKEQFVSGNNEEKKQINMSHLIKGTYVITVFFDGMEKQSVKVIKL